MNDLIIYLFLFYFYFIIFLEILHLRIRQTDFVTYDKGGGGVDDQLLTVLLIRYIIWMLRETTLIPLTYVICK